MRLSYIVSVYNSAKKLPCMLWSLMAQTDPYFEIIVTDNSTDEEVAAEIRELCRHISPKIRYYHCKLEGCYHSAEFGVSVARGEYVCFPSDDGYYMPMFGAVMLAHANNHHNAEMVACDIVYDPRCGHGRYAVTDVQAKVGWIDKTQFIVRRDYFFPFPGKNAFASSCSDGEFAEEVVRRGGRFIKLPDVLGVHN